MTARATIKQSDLRKMAKIANDMKVTVEYEVNGHKVKFMPSSISAPLTITMDKSKGIRL